MSNLIYNYIANKTLDFFKNGNLRQGDKYSIRLEKQSDIISLYNIIKDFDSEDFTFNQYETYFVPVNGINLIVAINTSEIKEDFLTGLFIHNTNLDSIIGGSESLQKEGMPLYLDYVRNEIFQKIEKSTQIETYEKLILKETLEQKIESVFEDTNSIFDYSIYLEAVEQDKLEADHFHQLNLFPDKQLKSTSDLKVIRERIKKNTELFAKIDISHKYGNPSEDLARYFQEDKAKRLAEKNWYEADFDKINKWNEDKNSIAPLNYLESNTTLDNDGLIFWDRGDSDKGAKGRKRNIIIFNTNVIGDNDIQSNDKENIILRLNFSKFIKRDSIKLKNSNCTYSSSGKSIVLEFNGRHNKPIFEKIEYSDKESRNNFEFKILQLDINSELFRNIRTCYYINPIKQYIIIKNEDDVIFNPDSTEECKRTLAQEMSFELNDENKLILSSDKSDDEQIKFSLNYKSQKIPFMLERESEKIVSVSAFSIWKRKREEKQSFTYDANNEKLTFGNKEYYVTGEFRDLLKIEHKIIHKNENTDLHWQLSKDELQAIPLNIDEDLKSAYVCVLNYFKKNNLIPSLSQLTEELKDLLTNYVDIFIKKISSLQEDNPLDAQTKYLGKVGTIRSCNNDKIFFTPLHPISIAYQLLINDMIKTELIADYILKSFKSTNLVPYIKDENGSSFVPLEETSFPEWIIYSNKTITHESGSKHYVKKLVAEKIREFTDHFSYLFTSFKSSPIKINLVNLGDCKEVLQGVFSYYINLLNNKSTKLENIYPIELHIYGNDKFNNKFEDFSFYSDPEKIEADFDIKLKTKNKNYEPSDLMDLFRKKVSFYIKENPTNEHSFEYAHISFFRFNGTNIGESHNNINEITSGVTMDGLLSSVPSVFINNSYRTGFGVKYITNNHSKLTDLVVNYNSFIRVAANQDPYKKDVALCSIIKEQTKNSLDNLYSSSHWVTFIDPKVDLNFFKNNEKAKDLVIIHYSDQYNNANGYDAITVTRRSTQYKEIISEYLQDKEQEYKESDLNKIINMFNAINGDWLLKLISHKGYMKKEKISILSAVKVSLALLENKNIIWVPVSMEEVLRISGGAGLKQKDGLFTAKNLGIEGSISDDLLMIGIESNGNDVLMHLYPIEVKIGTDQTKKAKKQGAKAAKVLYNSLSQPNFTGKFYRNFFAKLAIISASKMKLYGIWKEGNWDLITETFREKLLNDNFNISNKLKDIIGSYGVISFKKENNFRSQNLVDEGLILDLFESDGYGNLTKDINIIKNSIHNIRKELKFDHESAKATVKITSYEKDVAEEVSQQQIINAKEDEVINITSTVDLISAKKNNVHVSEKKNIDYNSQNIEPMKILFGQDEEKNPVQWYPTSTDKVMHTNTGIIGTMGTGKTQFTKSLIYQMMKNSFSNVNGTKIGILIFDYKGDYIKDDFVKATNATVYDLYHLPFNPLALSANKKSKPMLPLHTANIIKESISTAFNLGTVQKQKLRDIIMEAYHIKGIDKGDKSTWNNIEPTMSDICDIYLNDDKASQDSLYSALSNLHEFEIFEPDGYKTKSLYELIDGVTVINLSGYDSDIQNLVVSITLDLFYTQMQINGHSTIDGDFRELKKMILVDEADNFLSKNFQSLKKILKEGREFGVGTILSTQFLNHFANKENEYSNYILTWIIHRVNEIQSKEVKRLFNVTSKEQEDSIINEIKKLEKHYSIVNLAGSKPLKIRDRAFWEIVRKNNNEVKDV